MTAYAAIMFACACWGMLVGAALAICGLLETVADKGLGGETEQVDHRSSVHSGAKYVLDRTHDGSDL